MEQNTTSPSSPEKKNWMLWWWLGIAMGFLAIATCLCWMYGPHSIARRGPVGTAPKMSPNISASAPVVDVSQKQGITVPQPTVSPTLKSLEGPVMYNLGFRCPEFSKIRDSLTYKPHEPGALDSNLQLIWGNGRFRMMYDLLTVQAPETLPDKLKRFRHLGFDFEEYGSIDHISATLICPEQCVAMDVQRIRYVKGILYCMGKDAYVAVDIQKETWDVFSDTDKAPSPHKEEFAKLKEYDEENIVYFGKKGKAGWKWIPEPKPVPESAPVSEAKKQ